MVRRTPPEVHHGLDGYVEGPVRALGNRLSVGQHRPKILTDGNRLPLSRCIAEPIQLALGLIIAEDIVKLSDAIESGLRSPVCSRFVRSVQ